MNIDAQEIINQLALRIGQLETDKAVLIIQLKQIRNENQQKIEEATTNP